MKTLEMLKSNILYQKFSEELRRLNKDFATLPYLLGGGKLTANEEMLLKEIIAIGVKTETLIHEKAGLIDVPELRLTLIPRATSHFLMMRLAYNRTIVGEADKFRDLTFPRELDERLEKRKKELEDELKSLNTPSDFV